MHDQYAAALDMAVRGEDNGCVAVVLSEHHAVDDGYLPSPLVMAGAVAARTKTAPIMIAAALLPFYEPVRLAEDMSVLHHLSNGRVSYVFGLGYRQDEFALYGLDMRQRARIADTKLEQLLDALDRVTPRAEPRPPISWGGGSPAAARRAPPGSVSTFSRRPTATTSARPTATNAATEDASPATACSPIPTIPPRCSSPTTSMPHGTSWARTCCTTRAATRAGT